VELLLQSWGVFERGLAIACRVRLGHDFLDGWGMGKVESIHKETQTGEEEKSSGGVDIAYYTDPLDCWSWAMEPAWRKFQYAFGGAFKVRYKMAGLLPSWKKDPDAMAGRKPIHMGPEWMHAREISGMEINDSIWANDPPGSSLPACIAVKCAEHQSPDLGARYLRLLREAVMLKGRNISRTENLLEIASSLADADSSFNPVVFWRDLFSERSKAAFRSDWLETKYIGVSRLPTLVFSSPGMRSVVLSGLQIFDGLKAALMAVSPDLQPTQREQSCVAYMKFWHYRMTPREMEVYEAQVS
jgi:predicted DsbA family dithiol-disulfide isomerase